MVMTERYSAGCKETNGKHPSISTLVFRGEMAIPPTPWISGGTVLYRFNRLAPARQNLFLQGMTVRSVGRQPRFSKNIFDRLAMYVGG